MFKPTNKIFLLSLLIFSSLTVIFLVNKKVPNGQVGANTPITITYQPSSDDFPNPERGFMRQSNIWVDQPLDPAKISAKDPSDKLVWIYFHLENYRDPRDGKGVTLTNYQGKPLEQVGFGKGLDTVNRAFSEARNKGLKLVIRFLYVGYPGIGSTQDPNQTEPDAPLSLVQTHLNQLKPLFEQNKDVIAAFQFGFVGYWGEWHSSKYLGSLENRRAVVASVLAATPKDRMVQIRYPRYAQLWYGGPLTEANAYNQSDLARMALHDDAFLKDDTDDGTFKSNTAGVKITNYCDGYPTGEIQCWRDYFYAQSRYVPVGGEAGTHSSTPSQYALCPNALIYLSNMHFSFLHNGYSKVVLDNWVSQGCMPEIRRRLGYRLVLKDATIPQSVQAGGNLTMDVRLSNVGFAAMYNERPIYLVLQSSNNRYEIPLSNVDPSRWFTGMDHTVSVNVNLPTNIPPGTYKLGLWLPDKSDSLRNNSAYSIRFANNNVWEQATGLNILTQNFDVLSLNGSPPPTINTPTRTPTPTNFRTPTPTPIIMCTPPPCRQNETYNCPSNCPGGCGTICVTKSPTPTGTSSCPLKSSGDANCDSRITLIDFEIWRREFTGLQTTLDADYSGDGRVTLVDFEIWRRSFTGGV